MSDTALQELKREILESNDLVALKRLVALLDREGAAAAPDEDVNRLEAFTAGTGAPVELMKKLRALSRQYGEDDFHRAFAQHQIAERWRRWRSRRLKRGPGCPLLLTGEHTADEHGSYEDCRPPGIDHPRLWFRGSRPVVFTMQPYSLGTDDFARLGRYCDRHDFEARISSWRCWYFPGSSILVEIAPKGGEWWNPNRSSSSAPTST